MTPRRRRPSAKVENGCVCFQVLHFGNAYELSSFETPYGLLTSVIKKNMLLESFFLPVDNYLQLMNCFENHFILCIVTSDGLGRCSRSGSTIVPEIIQISVKLHICRYLHLWNYSSEIKTIMTIIPHKYSKAQGIKGK